MKYQFQNLLISITKQNRLSIWTFLRYCVGLEKKYLKNWHIKWNYINNWERIKNVATRKELKWQKDGANNKNNFFYIV